MRRSERSRPRRRARCITALALALAVVAGLLGVWAHSTGDRRPVLTGSGFGRAVAEPCAELRRRVAPLADFETPGELAERVRDQQRAVSAVVDALARGRPDGRAVAAYERALAALARWQAAGEAVTRLLTRRPPPALGRVVEGLAADADAAATVDDALDHLGGTPCVGAVATVDARSLTRSAGEAVLDAAGLGKLAEHDPACVVGGLVEVPFEYAVALEQGDVTAAVAESVGGVLDGCLDLEPILTRILVDVGHRPGVARCLAAEVAARSGWAGVVEIAGDRDGGSFTRSVAEALDTCA